MNAVTSLADHPYAQALAWALLHFLWQGALLGLAAMVCFRLFKRSATARYGPASHAGRDAGGPDRDDDLDRARPATWRQSRRASAWRRPRLRSAATLGSAPAPAATRVTEPDPAAHGRRARDLDGRRRRAVDSPARRMAHGPPRRAARSGAQSRRRFKPWPPRLAERLALRRFVDVVESAGVAVPIMVGWLKPVIVLPTVGDFWLHARSGRSADRARAGAHPPQRLPREPAAGRGRDGALLPPGRVVGVGPDSRRARALLR